MARLNEKQKKAGIIALMFLMIFGTSGFFIWGLPYMKEHGILGLSQGDDTVVVNTTVPIDWISFNPTWYGDFPADEDVDDVNGTEYYKDTSNMDQDDIDDIRYADLKLGDKDTNIDSDDKWDIEDDEVQAFLVTHADSFEYWVTSYTLGINNISLMNKTSTMYWSAYSTKGSQTINQTNDNDWVLSFRAATGHTDYTQGYEGLLLDYPNYCWNMTGIRWTLNATAKHSYYNAEDAIDEQISGVYLYSYFGEDWTSDDWLSYECSWSSDLGVEFEVISGVPIWGNFIESSITTIGAVKT